MAGMYSFSRCFFIFAELITKKNECMDIQMSYIIAPLLGGAVNTFI